MTDNSLLTGTSGGSGWDQTLLSSNPFEADESPSPMVSKPSSKSSNSSMSSISSISSPKQSKNKNKKSKSKSKKNVLNGNDGNTITNTSTNNNNNNTKANGTDFDDILDMFAPSTNNNSNNGNNNNSINNGIMNNNNDNPFLSFEDNPFASSITNNNNNNGYNNNNSNANSFDLFEPTNTGSTNNNINNNINNNNNNNGNILNSNNINNSNNIINNSVEGRKNRRSTKHGEDDESKSDYSTDSSVVSDQSDDESDSDEDSDSEDNDNNKKNNNNNKNNGIAPPKPPKVPRRSSRRIKSPGGVNGNGPNNKNNDKRHSAPVGDIQSVSDKLKSEGLIADKERKVGVDPRSPGVGQRIRNDKYVKEKEKEKNNNNKTKPTSTVPKLFEVLPELKRGTALLKYGKHGYPHFRQFNLSEDNKSLRWFSSKKKLSKSEIKIVNIHDVITGQHTKEFERIKWTTLTPASFSIIYGENPNTKKSLNLVAKSVDEMKMWVQSLHYLRNEAKKGTDLSKIKSVKVNVDFRDRNRPQTRKHSGNFLRSHETKETEINKELKIKLINDLNLLRKLYNEIEKEANDEIVQATNEFSSISQILSEIEERIGELDKEVRNTRNTKIAENDVWRTKIDLESLREKIRVLKKNNKSQYKKSKNRRWSVF